MTEHTPGPWIIDGGLIDGVSVGDTSGRDVFEVDCCGKILGDSAKEQRANARLIAAAPEMFELIKELAVGYIDYDEEDGQRNDDFIDFTHQAQALLVKIEGGGK